MESLQPYLTALQDSLPPSLDDRQKLNELVALTLLKTQDKFSQENRKAAWEYLLKNDIFQLAVSNELVALQISIHSFAGDGRKGPIEGRG